MQAPGIPVENSLLRLRLAVPFPLHEDRLSEVQSVQEVAGAKAAPVVEHLRKRYELASPDVPRLARGRVVVADTLQNVGLGDRGDCRSSRREAAAAAVEVHRSMMMRRQRDADSTDVPGHADVGDEGGWA